MECVCCGSAAVTEPAGAHGLGLPPVPCRECGKQFDTRGAGLLNRT
jgi:hypothetical protein